jgi:hypothetical protein
VNTIIHTVHEQALFSLTVGWMELVDFGHMFFQICKNLIPNLLMVIGDNRVAAQTIPKPVLMTRDLALNFIKLVMKTSFLLCPNIEKLGTHSISPVRLSVCLQKL